MKRKLVPFIIIIIVAMGFYTVGAQTHFTANLTSAQEGHVVTPDTATGTGVFVFNDGVLEFDITVEGLSGAITGAHFHRAAAGVDGPVVKNITADFDGGNTAAGFWTSGEGLDTLMTDLLAGKIYVNVHTAANPQGEIRGQVQVTSGDAFRATLNAAQETQAVTPDTATGTGFFVLTDVGLAFHITAEGLSGGITGAHFHNAAAGVDGLVVKGITAEFDGNTAFGLWTFAQGLDTLLTELNAGRIYVNIHTAANAAGEIRGQVLLPDDPDHGDGLSATLTAAQEVHTVTPDTATGTGVFVLTDTGLEFDITVEGLSGEITGAHFHRAAAGVGGPVVHSITADFDGNTATGIWLFTEGLDTLLTDLLVGNIYVNVHTVANAAGEIRGQVNLSSGQGFASNLDAAQELHAVSPDTATGTGSCILTDAGLVFHSTVEGLSGAITSAHFHRAILGVAGPVVHSITADFQGNTAAGVWTSVDGLDTLLTALIQGETYINVHTALNPQGEVRGQVLVVGTITSIDEGDGRAVPENFTLFQNYPNPFNPSTEIRFHLEQSGPTVLKVYNMLGQVVATLVNENLLSGTYSVQFEPVSLPSGVYIYKLQSSGISEVRKMMLLK